MRTLRVAPIVEGHGEVDAVRILLQRIWTTTVQGDYIDVLTPIRQPKSKLLKENGLERAVKLATAKLAQHGASSLPTLILILLDADHDCPAELGPELARRASTETATDLECVIAKIEYETWFVGSAVSLGEFVHLDDIDPPDEPELSNLGKGWIKKRFRAPKYSETVDQARMTQKMDLDACRARCPSFNRLCEKLEAMASRMDVASDEDTEISQ